MKDLKTEVVTFRTYPEIKNKLDEIASGLDRPLSWVINYKLKEMLSDQEKRDMDTRRGQND